MKSKANRLVMIHVYGHLYKAHSNTGNADNFSDTTVEQWIQRKHIQHGIVSRSGQTITSCRCIAGFFLITEKFIEIDCLQC